MSASKRYHFGDQIECGAQGKVVSAVDVLKGSSVAIKIFPIGSASEVEAFVNEYAVHKLMKEKSKRMCSVLDCFQIPNDLGFIVMEKYKQDLFTLAFTNDKKLSAKSAKKIFQRICRGVRDLHRNGVAHLDIKPENILIDEEGSPFLCDFGSSYMYKNVAGKELSRKQRSTVTDELKGRVTKMYAAPEVFSDKYNPFSADVFSLGILLYVLVSGLFPMVNNDGLIDLSMAKKKMNHRGFSLLSSMLEVHPEKRPTIEAILGSKWFSAHNSKTSKSRLIP